ncbi:MAG: CCA tRNA nucleotidyltransferase [Actinomycetota bacterium]
MKNLERVTSTPLLDRLGTIFSEAGFELALVGGPVRDAFLGRIAPDVDLTTNALPDEIIKVIKPHVETYWEIGKEFGTIGCRLDGETVEITTYRTDAYAKESRKPEVRFGKDLNEDLFRRDFTINAMALRLPQRVFVDPFGGLKDVLGQTIRTPGKPEDSFGDDPLRMLRAARFASQLGFEIEPETFEAMAQMRERLEIVSAERVQAELQKLLLGNFPRQGLVALVDSGLADIVLPELPALKLETDEHHHHKDVYEHTLTVVEQAIDYEKDYDLQPDFILRFAALLHDIGKPATRKLEPGGAVSFYHHDVVGAKLATKRMKALRFDNETTKAVAKLIELHLRFFGYSDQAWTDSAIRRYVRDAGDQLTRLHILTRSDVTTRNRRKADLLSHAYDDLEKRIAEVMEEEELGAMRPDLTGEEIMEILGLRPGPEVGKAYKYLLELRIENGPLGKEAATKALLEWWPKG